MASATNPDSAKEMKEALKAAIKEAAKEQETEKKDKDKKEKKETGIKPREFILPVLTLAILFIPVIVIYLPVFITARNQRDEQTSQHNYICTLESIPDNITKLMTRGITARADKNPFRFNATLIDQRLANATGRQMQTWLDRNVSAYLKQQYENCQEIAAVAFNEKADWPKIRGWSPISDETVQSFVRAMSVNVPSPPGAPPPSPRPPPRPPTAKGRHHHHHRRLSADDPAAAAADDEQEVSAYTDYEQGGGDYGSGTGDYSDSTDGTDSNSPTTPIRPPRPPPVPSPPYVKPTKEQMDAAIFRTISGVKGTTAKPGLAGFVKVDIALTVMDPLINQATFSVVATPGSVERYPYGIMDRKRVALNLPKSVSLVTDIQSAIGTSGKLEIKRGDSSIAKKADMPAIPIKSLYNYPFDEYRIQFDLQATLGNEDTAEFWKVALIVKQRIATVGWTYEVEYPSTIQDSYIDRVTLDGVQDGSAYLSYGIKVRRTSTVRFFAVFVLICMWIITMFACVYALDGLFIRRRPMALGDASLFTGLLFAMNGVRGVMPGVPPVGVGVDFYGFIWIMMSMMLTSATVYCRVVGQYVHNEPTLWDRFANRQYFDEWTAEKKKKEAEAKAKEEEKKKKEEEAKAKEAAAKMAEVANETYALPIPPAADPAAAKK